MEEKGYIRYNRNKPYLWEKQLKGMRFPAWIQDLWVNQNHYMERKLHSKATADTLMDTYTG